MSVPGRRKVLYKIRILMNRGGIKSINKALFAIKKRAEVNKEIRNNK